MMSGNMFPIALLGGGAALLFLLSRSDTASAASAPGAAHVPYTSALPASSGPSWQPTSLPIATATTDLSPTLDIALPEARAAVARVLLSGRDPGPLEQLAGTLSLNGSARAADALRRRAAQLRECGQVMTSTSFGDLPQAARLAVAQAVVNGADATALDALGGTLEQNAPGAWGASRMLRDRAAQLRMVAQALAAVEQAPATSLPSSPTPIPTGTAVPTIPSAMPASSLPSAASTSPVPMPSVPGASPLPTPASSVPATASLPTPATTSIQMPSGVPTQPAGAPQGAAKLPEPIAAVAQVLAQNAAVLASSLPGLATTPGGGAVPASVPATAPPAASSTPGPSTPTAGPGAPGPSAPPAAPGAAPPAATSPGAAPPATAPGAAPPATAPGAAPPASIPSVVTVPGLGTIAIPAGIPVPSSAPTSTPAPASTSSTPAPAAAPAILTVPGLGSVQLPSVAAPASTTALPAAIPPGQSALYEVVKGDWPIKIVERFTGKQTKKGLSDLAAANPKIGTRIQDGKIYENRDKLVLPSTWDVTRPVITHAAGSVRFGAPSEVQ